MEQKVFELKGVANRLAPNKMDSGYLEKCSNMFIDNSNRGVSRGSLEVLNSDECHSLWSNADNTEGFYCTAEGIIRRIDASGNIEAVASINGAGKVSFCKVNNVTVFSNGAEIGLITEGQQQPMPEPDEEFKAPMPPGTVLFFYNGRLYSAASNLLVYSDAYRLYRDERNCHIPLHANITGAAVVDGGVWMGMQDGIYFMQGRGPDEFTFSQMSASTAIPGTLTTLFAEDFGIEGVSGRVAVWRDQSGVKIGTRMGTIVDLSKGIVEMHGGSVGSVCEYKLHGSTYLITTVEKGGADPNTFNQSEPPIDSITVS